jgi:D-alanyl-D-alanine carboxypeptidase
LDKNVELIKKEKGNVNKSELLEWISAKSFLVVDKESGRQLVGKNHNTIRQIASLTKMMTGLLVVQQCRRYDIIPETTYLLISQGHARMRGTSGRLKA